MTSRKETHPFGCAPIACRQVNSRVAGKECVPPAGAWSLLVVMLLVSACAERGRPVVVDQAHRKDPVLVVRDGDVRTLGRKSTAKPRGGYVVAQGDTLYRIAWRFGSTVEQIAILNSLKPPYTIYRGQSLRVTGSVGSNEPVTPPQLQSPAQGKAQAIPPTGPTNWQWPVRIAPAREFGKGNKGLDFDLARSTQVRAAGSGVVVYSGVGLGGYQSLVIIRHNGGYLSAYSLNCAVVRKEGDVLKGGDVIADINDSGRAARFHFEIRKDGEPVGPRTLLR